MEMAPYFASRANFLISNAEKIKSLQEFEVFGERVSLQTAFIKNYIAKYNSFHWTRYFPFRRHFPFLKTALFCSDESQMQTFEIPFLSQ